MITRAEYDHVAILLEDRSGKLHIFEAVGALRHPCDAMLCTPHACTLVPYLTRPAQVLLRTFLPWLLRSPTPAGNSSDSLAARRADSPASCGLHADLSVALSHSSVPQQRYPPFI
jgi:hypothetical protein